MRGVVYNFFNSDIKILQDAFSIRTALLFCNEVTFSGIGKRVFTVVENLKAFTFEMKLHWVADDMKDAGRIDIIDADGLYKQYKFLNNKKGKSKDEIIWMKHLENYVKTWMEARYSGFNNSDIQNRLGVLKSFADKKYFHLLSQHISYPETENIKEGFVQGSKLLTMELNYDAEKKNEEDEEEPVFILPFKFYYDKLNEENISEKVYTPTFEYSYKLFTLPNINNASVPELEILRSFFQSNFTEFQNTTNEWLRRVYTNQKYHELFLTDKLIPICKRMEDAFYEHELIDHYDLVEERKFMCQVTGGACRLSDIWNFYRAYKAIPDETWELLMKMKKENDWSDNLWPFISFKILEVDKIQSPEGSENIIENDKEKIKPIKKNLDID